MESPSKTYQPTSTPFDVDAIRRDFPILERKVLGKPLVYLDNAATTQKPSAVIQSITDYYTQINSNVHRGVHHLSEEATNAYEGAREKVRQFLNAGSVEEIIFTKGTTGGINLVASAWGRKHLKAGDEVLVSGMEHHSNIVPWQMICSEKGAHLKVIPINQQGELDMDQYTSLLNERTRLVALVHISNALGSINPVRRMIEMAHRKDIPVLIDGAQAAPHLAIDVRDLDCDFYAFSGHKMYGPTGIGGLFVKKAWLEKMDPYQGGGEMIKSVTFEKTVYHDLPHRFEAGTPNIAGAIGLGAAIDYLRAIGYDSILAYESDLQAYASEKIGSIPGVRLIGTAHDKAGVVSFVVEQVHPLDLGTMLNAAGIAIRTGHHCAQPVMDFYRIPGTARASLGIYNTRAEIDHLAETTRETIKLLS